ncbi:polygalacturonase [Duganella sp. CF517]|uniref:glycoside hydrolase family 28 protein n=1 Tax=Duganella sp. CF517 TaxID=1881038 RepID=UPI0008D1FA8D|nr:glycosyl hydrolase family 28 protein [Duganella sp. CF517]SEO23956.1 polygalacturonase [Duganella sp. CF517]
MRITHCGPKKRPVAVFPPSFFMASAVAAALLCVQPLAQAQDTRDVREPTLPKSCAVVTAEAAEATNHGRDDAARIQQALDQCAQGGAVHLAAGDDKRHVSFTAGPLTIGNGVTLVIDSGVTLYASTNPLLFDNGEKTCGTLDLAGKGCRPFITVNGAKGTGIMGDGAIDGQGGQAIDGKPETWWQIARRAQKEKLRQNVPRLIQIDNARDFTMYRITLRNSPNFHVALNRVDGFTAWAVRIDTPHDARNSDGIDPGASRNVTIAHSYIRTGDDNIAIKAGNNGMSENISILHNHFYSGHGMSIGSETNGGVRNVLVDDLAMDGTTSGLRIKSNDRRGGVVSGIVYRNVCLRGNRWPLYIDTNYEPGPAGQLVPSYSGVRMESVHSLTPGQVILQGYDDAHPLRLALKDVVVDGNPPVKTASIQFDGQLNAPDARAVDCAKRFVPFPEGPRAWPVYVARQ